GRHARRGAASRDRASALRQAAVATPVRAGNPAVGTGLRGVTPPQSVVERRAVPEERSSGGSVLLQRRWLGQGGWHRAAQPRVSRDRARDRERAGTRGVT